MIAEWNTLVSVQASAAATLIGLVFVAVSINLKHIMAVPGLPGRAFESILQFLEVFLVSTVVMIPGQSERALAWEILALSVLLWTAQVAVLIRYLQQKAGQPWSWFVYRAVMSQLASLPFCVAGIAMLAGVPSALYWLVPGFVFSFVAGIMSAWVLLVEILR